MPYATHKRTLNTKQLHLLRVIYKFRYASAQLIAQYLGTSTRSVNFSLSILHDQGYVARQYGNMHRLHGTSARYYVTAKSLKLLRETYGLDKAETRSRYKDASLSDDFIDHSINIFRLSLRLLSTYPNEFKLYTRAETTRHDFFPVPLPELYLVRNADRREYFIDLFDEPLIFPIKKRVDSYVRHYQAGEWRGKHYPSVLLLCPNARTAANVRAYIARKLDQEFLDDKEILIQASETIPALASMPVVE